MEYADLNTTCKIQLKTMQNEAYISDLLGTINAESVCVSWLLLVHRKIVYIHLLVQHSSVVCLSRIPPMFFCCYCCCRCYVITYDRLYIIPFRNMTIVRTRTEIAMETDANFIVVTHQFYHLQVFQR